MKRNFIAIGVLWLLTFTIIQGQNVAFKTDEIDLIAEGIAFDSLTNTFFLSSSFKNKIVKVSKGKSSDFISSGQDGFVGGVGLHVDQRNRILWACTGNLLGKYYRTGIYAFDLNNGKMIKKIFFPKDTIQTLFNDIAITNNGTAYISNSFENNVWRWRPDDTNPQRITGNDFPAANGITLHNNNQQLYVATSEGIKMVNLIDNSILLLAMPEGKPTSKDLDGIAFYRNSILGVQDDFAPDNVARVVRYFLNEKGDAIVKTQIIDSNNSMFYGPTTLTLAHGDLYVLANSQLDNFDQPNIKIVDRKKLKPTFVLKYKLD